MSEEWKGVPGFDAYEISSLGRVRSVNRSVKRTDGKTANLRGKILALGVNSKGYPCVNLRRDGRQNTRLIHNLVALAFIGPRPSGMEVAHGDGIKLICTLANLRYATPSENEADKIKHGTLAYGERHEWSKLTDSNVHEIRRQLSAGVHPSTIGQDFAVIPDTIRAIAKGKSWRHLKPEGGDRMD